MKILIFSKRNLKEILRDPLNLAFGLGFPLILLILLSIINNSIPKEANNTMFQVQNLAPGLAMFGTAFMALFTGMLVAKDRTASFLTRLFISPMKSVDFILGYTLPAVAISAVQSIITFSTSLLFGLEFTPFILPAIFVTAITALFFIGIGLLCGTLLSDKSVGGLCGALLVNLSGWFSGVFIPLDLIGGGFKVFCEVLPFYNAVQTIKLMLGGDFLQSLPYLAIVLAYTAVVYVIAVVLFGRKMKNN